MGDPAAPSAPQSTGQVLQAYSQYFPQLMQATRDQIGPTEQTLANVQNQIAPQQQALDFNLYKQYAPQYAALQSQTQSANDLASIQGAGGQAALAAQKLQQQIDPEYYATRALQSSKLNDLLSNPISGSESAAIERANNQKQIQGGTFDVKNNADTITNAMNFGQAGRDRLGQALNIATGALPNFKSGQDTFAQATGRGGTQIGVQPGQGLNAPGVGQSTFGQGSGLLDSSTSLQNTGVNANANRRDSLDRVQTALGQAASAY